jgi:hypothetical protein
MAWRVAKCLDVLRQQLNAAYPSRSKATDGTQASPQHRLQSPNSDHNEKLVNGEWVVHAMDITHDPGDGLDCQQLFDNLIASKDRRIKYLIWNRQISNPTVQNWAKRKADDHEGHLHISVYDDPHLADDTTLWDIDGPDVAVPDIPREPVGRRFTDITATVFGGPDDKLASGTGAYGILDWRKPQVALPYNFKTHKEPLPKVRLHYGGRSVVADVADVGPWNTNDPYWKTNTRPQAESGFDLGQTKWGVRKTNQAGIDITVAAADALGLPGSGVMRKAEIDWEFVDAAKPVEPPPIKPDPPTEPPDPEPPKPVEPPPVVVPPIVVPPITPTPVPPQPPGTIDFVRLERLNSLDIELLVRSYEQAIVAATQGLNELKDKMKLNTPAAIMEAVRSGKTAAEIKEEREMSTTNPTGTDTAVVDVKPAYEMKTVITNIVGTLATLATIWGGSAYSMDATTQAQIVSGIVVAWGILSSIFRRNASSVSPSVAKQARNG